MKKILPISIVALCFVLQACGGGGGGGSVASTPAPIPAPAPTPAPSPSPTPPPVTLTSTSVSLTPLTNRAGLVAGTYQPIAIAYERAKGSAAAGTYGAQTVRILDSSATKLTANPAAKSYTLEINLSGFPGHKVLDLSKTNDDDGKIVDSNFGNHVVQTDTYSDGTRKVAEYDADVLDIAEPFNDLSATAATIDYYGVDVGLRYVSLGYWSQDDLERIGPGYKGSTYFAQRKVAFAFGRRTAAGELPASGTATYQGKIDPGQALDPDGYSTTIPLDFKLSAKFASREIAALISAPALPGDEFEGGESRGLSASGTGAIGLSGDYSITLTGKTFSPQDTDIKPVAGSLVGGFFGPGAEETGGVFKLDQVGAALFYGAYGLARTGS
jgi:hypothetical protein